jgi:aryl-alcohol dehydrogenase-like predicted oxidoreductase
MFLAKGFGLSRLAPLSLSDVTVAQIDEALAIDPVVAVQNTYSIDLRCPEAHDVLRGTRDRIRPILRESPARGGKAAGAPAN